MEAYEPVAPIGDQKDFPRRKLLAKVISPGNPIPATRRRDRSENH